MNIYHFSFVIFHLVICLKASVVSGQLFVIRFQRASEDVTQNWLETTDYCQNQMTNDK
jgi:hypothetical protein